MEKSLDAELVKKAQASTGALLWLATRTRPELSAGVAAMSRLCMKAPKETIQIGARIMEYLKRPTRGLIYAATAAPPNGVRNHLNKPRTNRTVEAFSDISYASTKGYRSVQGQVYYYAGAPVMWSTTRQPFPTQSTAESELVSLCEALIGGRAMTSLIAALRCEDEDKLEKRLWGDNSAAISLATREGQGSWRTRHLRIRAAILRSALQRGEWELGHLSGKELVADSFTKVVDPSAFEKALQDLCLQHEKSSVKTEPAKCQDYATAKLALLIGSSLASGASASGEIEEDEEMSGLWTCGVILMCVGAVYVGHKVCQTGVALWRRLRDTSGDHGGAGVKEHGSAPRSLEPQVRVLRHEQGEEWELCSGEPSEDERRVSAGELRDLMDQSRAVERDPYNKIHGREPSPWIDEDQQGQNLDRMLQRATGDQLPRRRKKKGKNRDRAGDQLDDDAQEAALRQHMQEHLLGSINRLGSGSATLTTSRTLWQRLMRQSGTEQGASGSSSMNPLPSSGTAASSSMNSLQRSGTADPSTRTSMRQSGTAGPMTMTPMQRSGNAATSSKAPMRHSGTEESLSPLPRSGSAAQGYGGSAGATSSESMRPSGPVAQQSERDRAASSTSMTRATATRAGPMDHNQWNAFQHQFRGRGWGTEKMRAEYWKFKATGKKPT